MRYSVWRNVREKLDEMNAGNMCCDRSTQGSLLHRVACFLSIDDCVFKF